MEGWVRRFMYDLPRKAIRQGTAKVGTDPDEAVFDVDGFRIILDGNEWRMDVDVYRDKEPVLSFVYKNGDVEVRVDKLGVSS